MGERVRLGDVILPSSQRNKNGECTRVYSVTNSNGFVPSEEYFNKEVYSKELDTYRVVNRGMLAYNPSRINVGSVALQDKEDQVVVSPLYVVFSVDERRIAPEYLLRFLKCDEGLKQIETHSVGTVRNNLKYKGLCNLRINLPSLKAQHSMVRKLRVIETLIDNSQSCISMLDQLVKSQFVEMFGDWQSGYRYELQKLGPLLSAEPQNGLYKPQKYYVDEGGVPIVRVDAFQTGFIEDFGALKRLECSQSEIDIYGLLENDIVINRVNGSIERVGKVAWIHGLVEPTVFESNMMRFHVDENRLELAYITAFLNSDDIRQQIKSRARIANQCSINQGNVMDFDIPLPPLTLQREYAAFVAEVDKSRFVARKSAELIMNMQALDIRLNARLQ